MIGDPMLWGALLLGAVTQPPDPAAAQTWTLTHPGAEFDDHFGQGTAVLGDLIFGGAPGAGFGRVFLFERQGADIVPAGEAIPADPSAYRNWGEDIDADGNWVAIAAPPDNNLDDGGAVVMFEVVGGGLVERATLVPTGDSEGDYFATRIDLDGETLAVWRYDQPEIYALVDGNWAFQASLAPSSQIASSVGSLALDGDTLLIGDPFSDVDQYENCGRAFVFAREGDVWSEQAVFTPESLGNDRRFATGVGLDGDGAVMVRGYQGTWIEVYERSGATWTQAESFQPEVTGSNFFGDPVQLVGDRLIVTDGGSVGSSGPSVLFRRNGPNDWRAQWTGSGGHAMGLDRDLLTIGQPIAGDNERGEVLVVDLSGTTVGGTCSDNADCLGGWCADGICCDQSCSGVCDVCSVAAGAEEDGRCYVIPGPTCCSSSEQCDDGNQCTSDVCNEENGTCTYENICCESDADCVSEDPCQVGVCAENGFCDFMLADGCEQPTTSAGSASASASASGGSGTDSAGATGGSGGGDGCSCCHRGADRRPVLWTLVVLLGLAARRLRR